MNGDSDLYKLAKSFSIKGPDDDGLFWLIISGGDKGKHCMFNLGKHYDWFQNGLVDFEKRRCSAIEKAKGKQE